VQMQGDEESRSTTAGILRVVLDQSMRLLHPFMPFVTEEVWQYLYRVGTQFIAPPASALIVASWPQANNGAIDEQAEQEFGLMQEVITRIRDARNQMNVEPARRVPVIIAAGRDLPMLEAQTSLIEFLARTEKPQLYVQLEQKPDEAMSLLAGPLEIYLPLAGLLDLGKELERLDKEIAQAQQEIVRLQTKLSNEAFVAKAKPAVVEKEREKLAVQEERIGKLLARRAELGG
jgi:valyl-tRNA synthetase